MVLEYILGILCALLHVRVFRLADVLPDIAAYGDRLPNLRTANASTVGNHRITTALRYRAHHLCDGYESLRADTRAFAPAFRNG